MVLILVMMFIAAGNVIGCVIVKKRGIQIFLGIAAWTWVLIALASDLLLYNINYKTTDIDVSESPDAQNETPKLDEDGYPTAQDYQAYKQEMAAVANHLGLGEFEMEYEITAKGYPCAIISRETNETTGQVTELHIILNEQHDGLSNREYVLQRHRFTADGTESASAEIVDFYLVNCATLEVIDERTTQWR